MFKAAAELLSEGCAEYASDEDLASCEATVKFFLDAVGPRLGRRTLGPGYPERAGSFADKLAAEKAEEERKAAEKAEADRLAAEAEAAAKAQESGAATKLQAAERGRSSRKLAVKQLVADPPKLHAPDPSMIPATSHA